MSQELFSPQRNSAAISPAYSDQEIYQVGIHTLPEVQPEITGPEHMIQRVYKVAGELLDKNKMLLMLGGEHSLTLGMVKAYRERHEALSVLQLDALVRGRFPVLF